MALSLAAENTGRPGGLVSSFISSLRSQDGSARIPYDLDGTIVVEADRSGLYTVHADQGEAPRPPPATTTEPNRGPAISSSPSTGCIDINTASVPALCQIIHIGPVRAQQIVVLRRNQPFRSIQDLSRVDGISSARVGDIIAEGKACVSP
jgi:Helix-hairpin-helix motif